MNKIFFILAIIWIMLFNNSLFSQSMNSRENRILDIKTFDISDLMKIESKTYEIDKNSNIILIYYPFYKEVRIVFNCPQNYYNEGDTIITIRNILLDFIKEKGFYHYSRLNKDNIKYRKNDNGIINVNYFVHVKIYK